MAHVRSIGGVLATLRGLRRRAMPALALVALAAPCEAAWHRLDSPNFVVVGDASPRQLRDIAVKFEAFREVLARVRGNEVASAAVPTVILVFRSDKAFSPYTPRYKGRATKIGGLFVPGRDINHIAFVNERTDYTARIIYHEYAHLVVANGSGPVPAWLNEGLAEVYSTFELTRDGRQALIGRPIGEHLALLSTQTLLRIPELLQVDHESPLYNEGERRSVFYAQSWALTHMIIFGESSRTTQLRTYLQRVSEGMPPSDAWAQAFGAEPIDRQLTRYIRRASYRAVRHRFSEKLSQFDAVARPLAPAEMHAFLAHFLLSQGRGDEAREHLTTAMKLDPQNPHAQVLRAQSEAVEGEHAAAVQRLLALGEPADWLDAYYAGVACAEAIERTQDRRPELVAAAGRFFEAAARQRSFPNAVIRRAAVEIAPGHVPADATILAVRGARSAAPGREDYALLHAQLLALRSDFEAARAIVGPWMSTAHAPRVREAARSLMGWIVRLERHRSGIAAAETARHAETPAGGSSPAAPHAEAGAILPVFREVNPDEERLEGVLQQIDCSAAGAAVFVVDTSKEIARLAAPRMAEVDFITYREDITGSVSCGPLKEPMRVYVTSRRPAKPDGAPKVVAVEFLPRERH